MISPSFFVSLNGDWMIGFYYTVCDENGYELDRIYLDDKKSKKLWPHIADDCHVKVLQYAINHNFKIKYKKIYLGCFKCNDNVDKNFINREILVSDGV